MKRRWTAKGSLEGEPCICSCASSRFKLRTHRNGLVSPNFNTRPGRPSPATSLSAECAGAALAGNIFSRAGRSSPLILLVARQPSFPLRHPFVCRRVVAPSARSSNRAFASEQDGGRPPARPGFSSRGRVRVPELDRVLAAVAELFTYLVNQAESPFLSSFCMALPHMQQPSSLTFHSQPSALGCRCQFF